MPEQNEKITLHQVMWLAILIIVLSAAPVVMWALTTFKPFFAAAITIVIEATLFFIVPFGMVRLLCHFSVLDESNDNPETE